MNLTARPTTEGTIPHWVARSILFAFWVLIGLLFASQFYVAASAEGETSMRWGQMLAFQVLHWGTWGGLTLGILWLIRHVPLERRALPGVASARRPVRRWGQWLALHVPASLLTAGLHVAFSTLVVLALRPFEMHEAYSFGTVYAGLMSFFFLIDVLVYWTVLAVGHAIDFYRKYRDGEAQLARAQLQALRMQLHPHFLFNTLNAIATLVRQQQNRSATDMIAGLSDLLRLTLENDGGQEVPLKQELDFLDRYLSIEQIRFGDRLQIDVDAAPETLRARVPNLVLQPLVENAVLHGIAPRSTPGRIVIRAERIDGHLRLQVRDDGPGFPDGSPTTQGVGLRNTAARLQHLYGPDHRIAFANAPEGGAVITLELPFHIDEPMRP